ncbi:polysaccharide pyruvyl transferase CsaB [Peptoniphilus sp.]|jgi:polysaccharide pyruvyl transferase CsaB|uniref:polysaccharide pyruvyl transferase CsaB n=1 Tax=Peptoniphilus sp. TaxID=1971214 RepID=UPI003D94497C
MKKIVMSGYFGFDNSGDDAILKAMVADFKKVNKDLFLTALSNNPEKTRKVYGINAVNRFKVSEVWKTLGECDIFLSGGGSLLQDFTSTRSIIYYLAVILMAKMRKKKVYVYANGIGPIDKGFSRFLTKFVLNRVDFITLRDSFSQEFVKKLGVKNKNILVTADPVFSLESATDTRVKEILEIENIKLTENTIGFCLRDYENSKSLKIKFAEVVDMLIEDGYDVLLVPFHMPRDNVYSKDIAELSRHKDKVQVVENTYSAGELMGIFKDLKLLVAMRLHSVIYGANVNLPMVGVIYDPKVRAMVHELGIKESVEVNDFTSKELYEKINKTLSSLEDSKEVLEKNTEIMRQKAHKNVEIAMELLEK